MRHDNSAFSPFNGDMRVDLLHSQSWEDWNESFRAQAAVRDLKADEQFRMYRGLSHAVCEIVLGTAIFFSHKKQLTLIDGDTWAFEGVLPHLYKIGFQIQILQRQQLLAATADAAEWSAWVEQLAKETNFVLWAEDHPVSAEFFDGTAMDNALGSKRILSIAVSHASHALRRRELSPYSVRLQSLSADFACARLGSRVRTPALFAHRQVWGENETQAARKYFAESAREDQALVTAMETRLFQTDFGFQPFPFTGARLWDRAVVFHPGRNGSALAKLLQAELKLTPSDSVSGCADTVIPELQTWWKPLPNDEVLRGLLVLGLEVLSHPDFENAMKKALAQSVFKLG